jgi:uncharacterized membrane protein YgcG
MEEAGADVAFIAETKIVNLVEFKVMAGRLGFGFVGNMRKPRKNNKGEGAANNGGGCGFLYRLHVGIHLRIRWQDTAGGVAVAVEMKGYRKFGLVGLYIPTTTSHYRNKRRTLLHEFARDAYNGLSAETGPTPVAIMGDFNARYLRPQGSHRHTHDVLEFGMATPATTTELRTWAATLGVTPLHGRPGGITASCTNRYRVPAGDGDYEWRYSELDYVFAGAQLTPDAVRAVEGPLTWSDIDGEPNNGHIHRPIAFRLKLTPIAAPQEQPPPPPPRQRLYTAHYNSGVWNKIAGSIKAALPGLEALLPGAAAAQAASKLNQLLLEAALKHLADPRVSIRSTVLRRLDGHKICWEHAQWLATARRARNASKECRRVGAATGNAAALAAAAELMKQAIELQALTKEAARAEHRQWIDNTAHDLTRLRVRDQHGFHRLMSRLAPEEYGVLDGGRLGIPDGPGGVPAAQRFHEHFKQLHAETRPNPPAYDSLVWRLNEPSGVPNAAADAAVGAPTTWREVWKYIFPPNKRMLPTPCGLDCPICDDYCREHEAWRHGASDVVPEWKPRLQTSKAGGPDGVPPEVLRWSRLDDPRERFELRRRVCTAVADVFNKYLAEGVIDAQLAESTITPLLKPVKPGQRAPDAGDPNNHRGINVGSVLPKIFSAVLTGRLTHWAARRRIFGPEQVGFTYRHGAEWHVFTLRETLKHLNRDGEAAYVLFVDLKKAYDRVHLPLLWRILGDMGVPANVITLLRSWAAARRARVRVNGSLTEPIELSAGVPQGDPLSPLLFNLFIECLSRYLETRADLPGATVLGVAIRRLLYADDIAIIAKSVQELQAALGHIRDWCAAYGMDIGTGAGKTEAVAFRPWVTTKAAATAGLPPLVAGNIVVRWSESYRYLGYMIMFNLREHKSTANLTGKLTHCWWRYFPHSTILRRAPPTTQLQVYKTCVLGATNYLRSVVALDNKRLAKLGKAIAAHARVMVRLPREKGYALAWSQSRLLTAEATVVREMQRLRVQFLWSRYRDTAIAPRLYAALRMLPVSYHEDHGWSDDACERYHNLAHVWRRQRAENLARGAVPITPHRYNDIPRAVAVHARSVAYLDMRKMPSVKATAATAAAQLPVGTPWFAALLPPLEEGNAKLTAWRHFFYAMPPSHLGAAKDHTPVSAAGPGCSGSLVAICDRRHFPALTAALCGCSALHRWPFKDEDGPAVDPETANHKGDCPLCGGMACCSLFHLLAECPHDVATAYRADFAIRLQRQLHETVVMGMRQLEAAQKEGGPDAPAEPHMAPAEWAALEQFLVSPPDTTTPQWQFIAYRALLATPWPRAPTVCGPLAGALPAAAAAGALFDALNVKPRLLRAWAGDWASWCEERLCDLARRVRVHYGLSPLAVARPAYRDSRRRHTTDPEDGIASQDEGEDGIVSDGSTHSTGASGGGDDDEDDDYGDMSEEESESNYSIYSDSDDDDGSGSEGGSGDSSSSDDGSGGGRGTPGGGGPGSGGSGGGGGRGDSRRPHVQRRRGRPPFLGDFDCTS